ncbi:GTP-binding protein [Actinoplanes sp. G11-F43]|uniref:GTP-binding protein n=1 Tax=Actinoplanes sp. G11-F43 TaxID=3424130 RepID=UPI003D346705
MSTSTDLVLCGFWPHATAEVAHRMATGRRIVLVDDLSVLPTGGRGLLVVVPDDCEPDQVRAAWPGDPPDITTVVPADLLLDALYDERVGDLVSRQIEQADTVVLEGSPEGDDEWEAEQLRTLVRRIAPWPPTSRGRIVDAVTRGLRGHAVGIHEPLPSYGVVSCVFHARRPFHPQRLHDALDEVTDGVLRSRGHFWLASRPDIVWTWESSGGLTLGPHSGWLGRLPTEHWDEVDPERCLAATVEWDPYYEDRHQHLAFIGIDFDPVHVHRTLTACLLTDDELSRGEQVWRGYPDPFGLRWLSG